MLPWRPLWIRWVWGYLFDMNQSTFISPAFWKPFMFPFSFCPHFIHYVSQTHTALSAFCCCCRWLFTTRQQIAFCWVLLRQTSKENPHALTAHAYTNTHAQWLLMFFCSVFSYAFGTLFIWVCISSFYVCWQQNGTSRFQGLASLDDITAIISTPPLGGFQVATPASPISC